MLGHYLLTLTPAQEDRVLTTRMRPGDYVDYRSSGPGPCLVGTVLHVREQGDLLGLAPLLKAVIWIHQGESRCVEIQYDDLCDRFGVARVNRVLRDRIWLNRLWRAHSAPAAFAVIDQHRAVAGRV